MTYIYEPETAVVKKCVELYLSGLAFSEIAMNLNKNGVRKFKLGEIYSQLNHLVITPIEQYNKIKLKYFKDTGCKIINL